VRGVRPAVLGTLAALGVLAATVALLGPLLGAVPVRGLQLAIGCSCWSSASAGCARRCSGPEAPWPCTNESAAFAKETQALRLDATAEGSASRLGRGHDRLSGGAAGRDRGGVHRPGRGREARAAPSAAIGAAGACVLVLAAGLVLRAPLSRIPENSLKFAVGGLLTGFWRLLVLRGLGAPWPGGDWAILGLVSLYPRRRVSTCGSRPRAAGEDRRMNLLRSLAEAIGKMFAADPWLTIIALAERWRLRRGPPSPGSGRRRRAGSPGGRNRHRAGCRRGAGRGDEAPALATAGLARPHRQVRVTAAATAVVRHDRQRRPRRKES